MKKLISYMLVFVLGFGACAFILFKWYGTPRVSSETLSSNNASVRPAPPIAVPGNNSVSTAASKVGKAVVNIDTSGRPIRPSNFPYDIPGILGFRFGEPEPVVPEGKASGVIIRPDGYILTNNHVVANTQSISITLFDKRTFPAKIIGRDPRTDLAVVKVDAKDLPTAQFGDSESLRVGDWVIAIGNALGLGPTVTLGVVSATHRALEVDRKVLEDTIQTDAAINRGNSGGALADINGNIVGINTAIASTSPGGGSIGIGFAIPSNSAKKIADDLIEHGRVVRPASPWIGIGYAPVSGDMREAIAAEGIRPPGGGVIVLQVVPSSPAEKAGLRRYDIILEINRKPIKKAEVVSSEIKKRKVGDKIMLLVWRNGENRIMTVPVGIMPEELR